MDPNVLVQGASDFVDAPDTATGPTADKGPRPAKDGETGGTSSLAHLFGSVAAPVVDGTTATRSYGCPIDLEPPSGLGGGRIRRIALWRIDHRKGGCELAAISGRRLPDSPFRQDIAVGSQWWQQASHAKMYEAGRQNISLGGLTTTLASLLALVAIEDIDVQLAHMAHGNVEVGHASTLGSVPSPSNPVLLVPRDCSRGSVSHAQVFDVIALAAWLCGSRVYTTNLLGDVVPGGQPRVAVECPTGAELGSAIIHALSYLADHYKAANRLDEFVACLWGGLTQVSRPSPHRADYGLMGHAFEQARPSRSYGALLPMAAPSGVLPVVPASCTRADLQVWVDSFLLSFAALSHVSAPQRMIGKTRVPAPTVIAGESWADNAVAELTDQEVQEFHTEMGYALEEWCANTLAAVTRSGVSSSASSGKLMLVTALRATLASEGWTHVGAFGDIGYPFLYLEPTGLIDRPQIPDGVQEVTAWPVASPGSSRLVAAYGNGIPDIGGDANVDGAAQGNVPYRVEVANLVARAIPLLAVSSPREADACGVLASAEYWKAVGVAGNPNGDTIIDRAAAGAPIATMIGRPHAQALAYPDTLMIPSAVKAIIEVRPGHFDSSSRRIVSNGIPDYIAVTRGDWTWRVSRPRGAGPARLDEYQRPVNLVRTAGVKAFTDPSLGGTPPSHHVANNVAGIPVEEPVWLQGTGLAPTLAAPEFKGPATTPDGRPGIKVLVDLPPALQQVAPVAAYKPPDPKLLANTGTDTTSKASVNLVVNDGGLTGSGATLPYTVRAPPAHSSQPESPHTAPPPGVVLNSAGPQPPAPSADTASHQVPSAAVSASGGISTSAQETNEVAGAGIAPSASAVAGGGGGSAGSSVAN